MSGVLADIETLLIVPDRPVASGEIISVTLIVMNDSVDRLEVPVDGYKDVFLEYGLERLPGRIELREPAVAASASIPPGGFKKLEYFLMIPDGIRPGPLKIIAAEGDLQSAFMMVGNEGSGRRTVNDHVVRDEAEKDYVVLGPKDIEELQVEKGLFFDNLSPYDPAYFLLGGDDFNAKFQISFKYRIFGSDRNEAPIDRSWVEGLHFSYTQLNFWDLAAASKPFADTNFKPEFFYLWEDVGDGILSDNSHLDLQFGFLHESNGRGGEESRSLNALYVKPTVTFDFDSGYSLSLTGGFQTYIGDLSDNPDIIDYRGHSSFVAKFGKLDDFQIAAALRGNLGTGKGLLTLDFTYPLNKLFINHPDLYIQTQLVTGYGEKMLSYDRNETRVRIGIGITR
ncbi:phospholipase A [Emcibacter sp.]|uniref:phospholipase A n=1 Tax=Emcibacter sp. TaxID=1979954 RepID=UPI003A90DCB5